MSDAKQLAKAYPHASIPLHLRNAPTKLMKDLGYNKDYKWEANFMPGDGFLPKEITDV
jgi:putative ATPase